MQSRILTKGTKCHAVKHMIDHAENMHHMHQQATPSNTTAPRQSTSRTW